MLYYKYLPIRDKENYFENELLRFTQADDLNDPFECLPRKPQEGEFTEFIKSCVQLLSKNDNVSKEKLLQRYNDDFVEKIFSSAYKKINNEVGILSLTKNWNNALMWSHYTNSHRGYCVGFNPEHDFFKDFLSDDRNSSRITKKVTYSEDRVKIPTNLNTPHLTFEPFLTKSSDWKYEEEVRVISTFNLSKRIIKKSPYNIYLFHVPFTAISEIILGMKIDINSENRIREFANEKNINIFKAKISDIKFNMIRE